MLTPDLFLLAYGVYPNLPYHNFGHAMDVMRDARSLARRMNDQRLQRGTPMVEVDVNVMDAIALFHDVIYVPGAADNEERSAEFAVQAISPWFGVERAERVAQGILDTKLHQPPAEFIESCLISDADMGGFAAPRHVFEANNARIDEEFLVHGHIDPGVYAAGRRGFLEGTLDAARTGRLYHVPVDLSGRHGWAVANLERELARLS